MSKITMNTPIVEMDGDEMTRIIWKQIKDIGLCFVMSALIGLLTYYIGTLIPVHEYLVMCVEVVLFAGFYWLASLLFKFDGYFTYKNIILSKIKK